MNKYKIICITNLLIFVVIGILLYLGLKELNKSDVLEDKSYNTVSISEDDIRDYRIFKDEVLFENSKFSVLLQLDSEIRKELSEYMNKNNLRLSVGVHRVKKRVYKEINGELKSVSDVTVEDIISGDDFKFEVIN